jgi:hypothetical protein
MSQLLLEGPYGWDSCQYAAITLNTFSDVVDAAVAKVLAGYGCHKPAIPKILNSLRYSNHYECYLQYGWFRSQHKECIKALAEVGVKLSINYFYQDGKYSDVPLR